jgi:hypothetical protein
MGFNLAFKGLMRKIQARRELGHDRPVSVASLFFIIKSSACSITVSNTTCYCLTFLVIFYSCSLQRFIFSKSIVFMYLINCFKFLWVSSLFLTDQLPSFMTLFCKISLSYFSLLHSNIKWSTVCMPVSSYSLFKGLPNHLRPFGL